MAVDKDLLLVVKSSGLGEGEPDLGEKLMKSFLAMLLESGRVPARMIFMNSGIFLTTQGSAVADLVKKFEERGSEIFTCGTCLEYFQRKDKLIAGRAGNMRDTVNAMLSFAKVLSI
jgi:selenium metabolism protein YedF